MGPQEPIRLEPMWGWVGWGAGDDREVGGSHEVSCKPCEGGDEGPREPAWWPVVQRVG